MPISIITIPESVKLIGQIDTSACTHPAGHCYGSDGGSGIPKHLKVAPGRGGEQRVWTLSADLSKVEKDEWYIRCQYCLKCTFLETNEERQAKIQTL